MVPSSSSGNRNFAAVPKTLEAGKMQTSAGNLPTFSSYLVSPSIPKAFQSMRSSRENEMVEEYPLKCVVDWVGHDIKVAAKHYLDSSNEKHHLKAISGGEKVTQNPTQSMTARGGIGQNSGKCQENKKAASTCNTIPCGVMPGSATLANPPVVGDTGLEPVTPSLSS